MDRTDIEAMTGIAGMVLFLVLVFVATLILIPVAFYYIQPWWIYWRF